jgi:hypothetical protein
MAVVGMAGLRDRGNRGAAANGRSAHLCATHALFTLVGIAAEDDLDAPDLDESARAASNRKVGPDNGPSMKPIAAERPFVASDSGQKAKVFRTPPIVLALDQSAAMRDRLIAELENLQSGDEAADWAHNSLPAKNTLISADAERVGPAFGAGSPGSR